MRKILIALLLSPLMVKAQNPATLGDWAKRLKAFGQNIPQEEIFIHMDNTSYYQGDTLYFKAYMRQSNAQPSRLSHMLYAELISPDGFLVERQKIEMTDGQGNGTFILNDSLYGGYYELRAYTRWQLNWGIYEHPHTKAAEQWFYNKAMAQKYYRDYEKLYSRVFPLYNKPNKAGAYDEIMTTRRMQRYFKTQIQKTEATLSFYPEGGYLVEGTTCNVAFQADNKHTGEHLTGIIKIKNSNGEIIATTQTENRGRGSFTINVKAKEQYTATFQWDNNSQQFILPTAQSEGVALSIQQTQKYINIQLQATETAAKQPLGLTATQHGISKAFYQLPPATKHNISLPLDSLETGIVQINIFNAEGRVWADRLVFVNKEDLKKQYINITNIHNNGYEPYEPITLYLQGQPKANISLAVRDNDNTTPSFDSGNILTEMLLCSQIRGYVEQPDYFFENNDDTHRRHLDLLLMVQGWRRYKWIEMATPGAFTITQPYERTQWIYGSVNKKQNKEIENEITIETNKAENIIQNKPEKTLNTNSAVSIERFSQNEGNLKREVRVRAEFVQPATQNCTAMGEMDTYNKGHFRIQAPKFYQACYFFLEASDTTKWKQGKAPTWIAPSEDEKQKINYPEFYIKLDHPYPRFTHPYNFYQIHQPLRTTAGKTQNTDTDKTIVLKEINIGASKNGSNNFDAKWPALVLDAYEAFNETVDAGLCPGYFIGAERFCYDLARTYISDMNQERNYEIERRYNTLHSTSNISIATKEKYNHLPYLDKVYIYTDYSPRLEGDIRYQQSNQPKVIIDLRRYEDNSQRMVYRNRRMILTGFSICEEFYHPDYSKKPITEPTDYRRTLYWEPNLKLDEEGKATVNLYNNAKHTRITVSAEGMTSNGNPLTGNTEIQH